MDSNPWGIYLVFEFQKKVEREQGNITQTNVCQIGVCKNIIYGHCITFFANPKGYFVVIPNEHLEKTFQTKEEWDDFLKDRNVNSNILYDVLETYEAFKKDYKTLPWYNEVIKK